MSTKTRQYVCIGPSARGTAVVPLLLPGLTGGLHLYRDPWISFVEGSSIPKQKEKEEEPGGSRILHRIAAVRLESVA